MLRHLTISNIALIDKLSLDFEEGFSALTGETGAGKSILIEAVGLALGERAYRESIRTGAQKGAVEALFTVKEGTPAAEYLLDQLDGRTLEMPVVYDWEYIDPATADGIPRTVAMSKRMLTNCTKAFCDTIKAAGYAPMIYFNADQSHKKMYMEELTDYAFWLASYTTDLRYPYKIDMWQYTATGTVPGIEGDVDINLYLKYDE